MPPKKKPNGAKLKAKAKATARASNKVVINLTATRRKPSRRTKKTTTTMESKPIYIYQQPPVYNTSDPTLLQTKATIDEIARDVAALKLAPFQPNPPNPLFDAPLYNAPTPPSSVTADTGVAAAEAAVARATPTAAPSRLPLRAAGRPVGGENTMINPETGANIVIGGATYKRLVRRGVIPS